MEVIKGASSSDVMRISTPQALVVLYLDQLRVIPLESMALAKQVAEKIVERKIKRGYQACTREQQ